MWPDKEMAVPDSLRLKLLRFAASTKAVRTLSSPPQGLHHDDEMYLFCEQTQMESDFGYPMAVGRATTLEGNNNYSSGVGALTLGGPCPSQSIIILL